MHSKRKINLNGFFKWLKMKEHFEVCPLCNRKFWGEDRGDCCSMIVAHIRYNCATEKKDLEDKLQFFKEIDERSASGNS